MASMQRIFTGYRKRLETLNADHSNPYAQGIAWIEGSYVPIHEARIPLLDQGFLHSDLTYDVPGVWDGRFFRLDDHLERFTQSLQKIRLQWPIPRSEARRILIDMVAKSGIRDAYVEIIVTRGLKGVRGSQASDLKNVVYFLVLPYVWVMPPEVQRTGGSAVIAQTVRRIPVDAMDPTVKNLQWGDFTKAMFEARDRGADHPFLTDGHGNLTEGSGFNVCIVKDSVIYTPKMGVLEGVTRKSVIDAARILGVAVKVETVPIELVYQADEIFMCTTAGGIMPITTLDGKPVNDGKLGIITVAIWDQYWEMHHDSQYSFEIDYTNSNMMAKL